VSPIYSYDEQDSGTVAGSDNESIFDSIPESETDLDTDVPNCSPHEAQLVELDGSTAELEHPSLSRLSFYENSDRSLPGIILQHAHLHDVERNELTSKSVEPITRAEPPFSFHGASSYVDNFVPELFEPVLKVAGSSVSSETASPHPGFGFEVADDVHSIDGEPKSSSKSNFTLAQPPIKAEYLEFIISWILAGLNLISSGVFALFSTVEHLFADTSLPEEVFGREYNEADRFTDINYSSDIDDAIEAPTDAVPPDKTSFYADHERRIIAEHSPSILHSTLAWLNFFWEGFRSSNRDRRNHGHLSDILRTREC
jgi:hypothetical protein